MAISGTHHGHAVAFALLVLLSACLSAPQSLRPGRPNGEALVTDGDLAALTALAGELRAVAGRLHRVSDSLMAPGPVDERDAVEAASTETASGTSPLAPPPPLLQSTAAAVPEGLPDNDTFRRRLFFIGAPGDEGAREPARDLLPPYADGELPAPPTERVAATTSEAGRVIASPGSTNQAVDEDADTASASFSALHEKDLLQHRLRPGFRVRPDVRDAEIRRAMEGEEFQGPLPEAVVVARVARPGHTYRWTVAPGPGADSAGEQAE